MTTSLFLQSCDGPMSPPTDPHDDLSRAETICVCAQRPRPPPLVNARPTSASRSALTPRALSSCIPRWARRPVRNAQHHALGSRS